MRGLRVVGVCVLAVVASGCWWTVPGEGPNRQAFNRSEDLIAVGNVSGLIELWAAPVDGAPVSDPVTSVRGVHVADAGGVYGFNAQTGARLWTHTVPGGGVQQPYVRNEQVLAGSIDPAGNVGPTVALDAASGSIVGEITSSGVLVALRGERAALWSRVEVISGGIYATVVDVLDLETSTWPCCDGRLFSADSVVPAELTLGTDFFFHAGQGLTHPDIDNLGNGVRAYSIPARPSCPVLAQAHCPRWARPIDGNTATVPVLDDDGSTLYVGTDAGTIYAINAETGDTRWTAAVGSPITDAPALAYDTLYIPTVAGLVAVDATCGASSCLPLWTGNSAGEVTQQPAVASGVVFIAGATGQVAAFDATGCSAATCEPLWSATTSPISGAPAISDGRVHVGTADGQLVTFGHPPN